MRNDSIFNESNSDDFRCHMTNALHFLDKVFEEWQIEHLSCSLGEAYTGASKLDEYNFIKYEATNNILLAANRIMEVYRSRNKN